MTKFNNFFTEKESITRIDVNRLVYLFMSVVAFFLTEAGRKVYRPYIYNNNIDDYGIADSIGNSGGIIVQIFFSLAIINPPQNKIYRLILFVTAGYILYEFLQPVLPRGVFDWLDIYGTIVGGIISLLLILILNKTIKNRTLYKIRIFD